MKEYSPEQIRNIAVIGHGGSGKTIFADAMLMTSGAATRIGKIEDGSTASDYRPDEIERQISINTTLITTEFQNYKINLLDTPGYTDFIGEVLSALHISDVALLLLKAVEGVEVGTELVWKYTDVKNRPVIIAVNKLDNENAVFDDVVKNAQNRFGNNVVPVQFPVGRGAGFTAIIDVLLMKQLTFAADTSGNYTESDIPADLQGQAEEMREAILEKVAESSEELLNTFFENGTLTDDQLRVGLRQSILNRQLFPLFCTAASKNVGVKSLLEFICHIAPGPADLKTIETIKAGKEEKVTVTPSPNGDPLMFVFKTLSEQHVGELSLFRVFNGAITPGLDMVNHTNGKSERINQMFVMKGRERKEIGRLVAGDIGAVVKLKDTHTNNTLGSKAQALEIPKIVFPDPVITGAVKSKSKGDEDKIGTGLHTMHEEDPSFLYRVDSETHETIVLGQGETHLELMIRRIKQRFGIDIDLMPPRIPYRETIRRSSDVSYKHKKQTGGAGQYGEVYIKLDPLPRGGGYEFVDAIVGGVIGGKYVPAVDKGIQELLHRGVISGYPMVDVKVTLYDGSQHPVDSNEMAFKIAGQMAMKKAVNEANPILLEPIYDIEVIVPDEFMGDVMGDISSHRGKIQGMDAEGPFQVIRAKVPLSELYQYATRLRSITQGRGMFRRTFSHYEEVPMEIQAKIVEAAKLAKEEEG